jgi:hypothetical protein
MSTKKMAPSIPPRLRVAALPAQAEAYGSHAVTALEAVLMAFLRWLEITGGLPPDPPARMETIRDFLEEMKGAM